MEREQIGMRSQANWQILLDADLDGLMKIDGLPLERVGVGIAPKMWALWCEDQSPIGGRKISTRAVTDHLRKRRGGGHGQWFGGFGDPTKKVPLYSGGTPKDQRLWFFGARAQQINRFGVYHPKAEVFGGRPFWSIEEGLLGEEPKDFARVVDPETWAEAKET